MQPQPPGHPVAAGFPNMKSIKLSGLVNGSAAASLVLVLGLATNASARPTATEDTGTAEYRHWETEIGFEFEDAPGEREFVIAPAFAYGMTPRLETELSWDYVLASADGEPSTRQLVTAFEFKGRFWEPAGEDGPSAGVKGKFAVPANVSGPRGSTDPEGYLKFIYAQPSGAAEMNYNLGYKYHGAWNSGGNDTFFAGIGFRYRTGPRWQWLGEMFAEVPDHRLHETTGVAAAGFKWRVKEGLKADLLLGTGLGPGTARLRVACGLTWEL